MRATLPLLAVALATSTSVASDLRAQDRMGRRLTSSGDVVLGGVRSIAQDSAGFVWLGTSGGLVRWDGVELRRWDPERLDGWINYQTVCPDGVLYLIEEGGGLFRITASGADPVAGPDGAAFADARNPHCDTDGALWITAGPALWRRDPGGGWREAAPGTFAGDVPFLLQGPPGPGAWLRTSGALWRLEPDGSARVIVRTAHPQAVAVEPGGDTLLLTRGRGLWRLGASPRLTEVVPVLGRGIDMQPRGGTIWVTFDRSLVAIRPGEPPEIIGSDVLPEGGGLMLMDHEGSLWIATFTGAVQFPEPETVYWHDRHGFPSAHSRFVARTRDRAWSSTWQGLGFVTTAGGRRIAHTLPPDWNTPMPLHVDERGVLWAATAAGLREVQDGRTLRIRPFGLWHGDMEPAPDGGVWLATSAGLQHAPADRLEVVPVPGTPFAPGVIVRQILRTRAGHLWLAGDERICGTRTPARFPRDAAWTCDSIPGAVEIWGLAEMPSGAVWAASSRLGVWRQRGGRWEPLPGNATLTARSVYRLRPASDEGVWILGIADAPRVRENLASPLGWDVLETLTPWQGMTLTTDLHEDPDGTLWASTSLGMARVPPAARGLVLPPVRVELVEILVDGRRVDDPGAPVSLRHRHNRLDVRFAALSYRDAAKIRYQVRLAPRQDWSDHAGPPAFRWIDLPAGEYRAEVRASLDGRTWSPAPAAFAVTVRGPWFLQLWALGLGALAVAGLAYTAHRLRVGVLLRLERQRTAIALDLHDEMGSGLGSIGILSGVLTGEPLETAERNRLTSKIGEIAAELGASLSNIIWSLRGRPATLQDVAGRLAEHGSRLFAGDTRFEARFPDRWPGDPLDAPVSRALLLIGFEALYNAARHAAARRVTLTVTPLPRGWVIVVEDDGRGLPDNGAAGGRGLGRASMRERAAEIGAELAWEPGPDGGTRVTLRWVPRRRSSGARRA